MDDVEADEAMESGEDESEASEVFEENLFSRGKSTAMVPPKVGRLLLPHMVMKLMMMWIKESRDCTDCCRRSNATKQIQLSQTSNDSRNILYIHPQG